MTGGLVLGLVAALAVQEPAHEPDGELARLLLADVRAWLRAADLPAPEDLRALVVEAGTVLVSADLARELGNLGHRLGQAGRDAEARELVAWVGERALAAGDLATGSWSQDWLGQEAWVRGDLDAAAELLAEAAEADARRGAVLERTRHLSDVARIRLTQGRFEDARAAIRLSEETARATGSSAAARAAAEVHGSLLFELGRHREALELCLAHARGIGEPTVQDQTQVRLDILAADVLADVGRLEAATTHARRAHETALAPVVQRDAPLLHLEAKLALGLLLGDQTRCDEALALLDSAAAEFARLRDPRGAAWADKNRGFALFAAGRLAESLPAFERAWQAGETLEVPLLAGLGALGLAEALVLGGPGSGADEARVAAALNAAERVAQELHERQLEWRCAALRGRIRLARGEHEAALGELRRAVVLIERWRRRLGTSGLVEHALRLRSDPYRDAAFAAARLGRAEEALAFAGLLQARVLAELCARRDGPLPAPSSPRIDDLRERIVRLEREGARAAAERRAELEQQLARAEDELDAALLADELAAGLEVARPDERLPLARVSAALAQQGFGAALVYVAGERETLALRLAAGADARLEARFLPLGRARLGELVACLRAPIERLEQGELDLSHLGFDVAAARELQEALVRPLDLPVGAPIALVTEGELATIPFELLVRGGELGRFDAARPFAHLAELRFLGDEHVFVAAGSLARIAQPVEARAGRAVVFLAPPALAPAHASADARAVARAFPDARIVDAAGPEDVAREARGAALVHFAAHGRLDPARPAHGHLVLGAADGAGARLESWQAAELELDGATVVLSACHSGRGEWLAGAGLAGLTRGFLLAGAREVVASRWAVDDHVAARFMELFYAELGAGRGTAAALHAARAKLRSESDSRGFALSHPAFWAGWFVLR